MQQDGRKTIYIAQSIKECLSEEFEQDNETVIMYGLKAKGCRHIYIHK